jgi:hypothetical protein
MIESLGQKTFRLTDIGLNTARSIESDEMKIAAWRRTVAVDACSDQTTESALRQLLDESGQDAGVVAMRLLATVLATRFPENAQAQELDTSNPRSPMMVGNTVFSTLIPATVESLRDWLKNGPCEGRRALVVRDDVRSHAVMILGEEQQPVSTATYGFESFLGQMIDGMASYEQHRIMEVMNSVIRRYNRRLQLGIPRIEFNIIECTSQIGDVASKPAATAE